MKTDSENMSLILNSLGTIGIYVIREDDHRVLFCNQRAQTLFPDMCTGAVCSDAWLGGSCSPLIDIGDKKTNQSFNYDGPLHQATDIVAARTLWDGTVPAFIITVTPHAETYHSTYEKIVKGNLTTNECAAIKMTAEERARLPETGFTLTMALQSFVESGLLYDEDVERFIHFSNPENMGRELKNGKRLLTCNYRRVTEKGCRWNTMEVLPDVNYTDDNQSVMIYVKDVQDAYREGLTYEALSMKNEMILKALGKENFGVYVVSLETGKTDWIRVADEDRSIICENDNWDEVVERLAEFRYHPDYREKFRGVFERPALSAAMSEGKEKESLLFERSIEGKWCYVNASAIFYRDSANRKYAILAFQNLDKYVRRELEHYRVEKRMASVIRSGYRVMNFVDLESGTCGRAILEDMADAHPILGNYEEWVEKAAQAQVYEEDREGFVSALSLENLRRKAAEVENFKEEIVQYRMGIGDSYRWLEQHIYYVRQDGKVEVSMFGRDVTEEKLRIEAKRQEEERDRAALEDALKTANAANTAKSDFLSRMSHDIRTPMNAIIGMTAIARTHLDDKERVTDCLSKITASSRHLLSLINEVLDLSKIESGRLELAEEEFELSNFFDELMTLVLPSIHAKNQNLSFRLFDMKHEKVVGDMPRLQQVFTNILSNAVKYTPENGKLEIEVHERSSSISGYGYYDFVFRDNGIGMSEEYIKHIFEPFSRADSTLVRETEGTGLGMAIVRNIVQMMSGDITVKSRENEGSEFTVSLYLKLGDSDDEKIKALIDLPVLVADDDKDACEAACLVIDELGMKSEWVLSGAEAVEKVDAAHRREQDYFAVILDWKMPGMDGIETARQIRRTVGPEVPIIILSAFDWAEVEDEAREAGVNGFIAKPLFKSRLAYLFKRFTDGAEEVPSTSDDLQDICQKDYSDKQLLLVEDNDLNREIAAELIGMTGVKIDCAVNGEEAVEKFRDSPVGYYDLVFMDIQMPIMNGYEATRAIRAMDRADAETVPIIAMSANAFASDIRASSRAGMNEHIIKPLSFKHLTKCMDKWLR